MSSETRDKGTILYLVLECNACADGCPGCIEPCQLIVPYGHGDSPSFLEQQIKEERLRCILDGCNEHGWKIVERIQVNREEEL